MLSDSVLLFKTIHDRVKRCETGGLRDGTWLADEIPTQAGLDIESPGFAKNLWHGAQQAYSLEAVMGMRKFGPHYVVMKTPLNNIRIATFFAGESEVKIIDPSRITVEQVVGCEVGFIPPEQPTPSSPWTMWRRCRRRLTGSVHRSSANNSTTGRSFWAPSSPIANAAD
jgi:hypothetical protein